MIVRDQEIKFTEENMTIMNQCLEEIILEIEESREEMEGHSDHFQDLPVKKNKKNHMISFYNQIMGRMKPKESIWILVNEMI